MSDPMIGFIKLNIKISILYFITFIWTSYIPSTPSKWIESNVEMKIDLSILL